MKMSEWSYPLEIAKFGPNLDERGNVFFQVRDAKKRPCFYVRIDGRETFERKSFEEDVMPAIVNGFNAGFRGLDVAVEGNGSGEALKASKEAPRCLPEGAGGEVEGNGNGERRGRAKKPDSYYLGIAGRVKGGMDIWAVKKEFGIKIPRIKQIVKEWGDRV